MSVVIVTEDPASQMGVTVALTGDPNWLTYLEKEVAESNIDQSTADAWEEKYDGYKMTWSFANP